jgi:hypothetical protein
LSSPQAARVLVSPCFCFFFFSSTNKIHLQKVPAVQLGNTTNPFCLPSLASPYYSL